MRSLQGSAVRWPLALRLLRRRVVSVVVGDLAAHDFSVERKGLQHDVEAAAILVREQKADIELIVVMAFGSNSRCSPHIVDMHDHVTSARADGAIDLGVGRRALCRRQFQGSAAFADAFVSGIEGHRALGCD